MYQFSFTTAHRTRSPYQKNPDAAHDASTPKPSKRYDLGNLPLIVEISVVVEGIVEVRK